MDEDIETLAGYLTMAIAALVARCGGEVTLTPQEFYQASLRDCRLDRVGENYRIMVGPKP